MCVQDNKETTAGYTYHIAELFRQLKRNGYKTFNDLEMTFNQWGIIQGAYKDHSSFQFIKAKLHNPNCEVNLKAWETLYVFRKLYIFNL